MNQHANAPITTYNPSASHSNGTLREPMLTDEGFAMLKIGPVCLRSMRAAT